MSEVDVIVETGVEGECARGALALCGMSVFIQQYIRGFCESRRLGQRHFSSGQSGRTVDEYSGSRRYGPEKRLSVTAEDRGVG